ncbi:MAG: MOSC domain-containing protein [Deltaproteobacteria bacterium]|nr:MOSC domain-containing protein [Deltaproteobacteria bacterium]
MKIVSINVSTSKGTPKQPVDTAELIPGHGVKGDGHAGDWHRQVSFLAAEKIETARAQGLDVGFGDFAENITTTGVDWPLLPVGTRVRMGDSVLVEITQIGKVCHKPCAIYYRAGDCIMPKSGVFAKVLMGGAIHVDDPLLITDNNPPEQTSPVQE